MTRPIIIDTDPGPDDALALLLALGASDALEELGITTVAGNVPVGKTTLNALKICELAGRPDVPVHAGCARPILRPLETAEFICGADGLAGMSLPAPTIGARPEHAVGFLVETLRARPDGAVTLCALGPLTNVALALIQAPEIAAKLERVVVMGGARDLGNMTAAAEFNFYVDPHAARVVFEAGVPITLFALNATYQAVATRPRIAPLRDPGGPVSEQVIAMLERPRPGGKALGDDGGHPMHDPCVIAYVLWPELFTWRDCRVDIEVAEGPTVGRSTIDWWNRSPLPANVQVIDTVDADAMFARLAPIIQTLD
ncbi:MAG: nucleoside hydrolase [Azospirillaceae bacterium]